MRVRKHVNPLNPFNFRRQTGDWQLMPGYPNPDLPLDLELGFARAEFLLALAKNNPARNYVGFEVREPLVDLAKRLVSEQGQTNIQMVYGSSAFNLELLPTGKVENVYIFFPDPWYKKRHQKRRIVNAELLAALPVHLADNHHLYFQTDVETLYTDTLTLLQETKEYTIIDTQYGVQSVNGTGIPSYYEQRCLEKNWPIYRIEFRYTDTPERRDE